jgi:phosphonate transport system permease protein
MVMPVFKIDYFLRQQLNTILVTIIIIGLTVVAIDYTDYDIAKGFESLPKAFNWGIQNFYPNEASLKKMPSIMKKLQETLISAVTATTCASFVAFIVAILGATSTRPHWFFSVTSRGIASIFRNIDVSAWSLILLFSFGQSTFTGYLALLFVTFGFMVRVLIETIDEIGADSIEAIRATGASASAVITQSVIPTCLPRLVSWMLFMIETNIRSATLIGILTGTGIGYSFDLYYKNLNYPAASLVIVVIVITVLVVESFSNVIRRIIQ